MRTAGQRGKIEAVCCNCKEESMGFIFDSISPLDEDRVSGVNTYRVTDINERRQNSATSLACSRPTTRPSKTHYVGVVIRRIVSLSNSNAGTVTRCSKSGTVSQSQTHTHTHIRASTLLSSYLFRCALPSVSQVSASRRL